MSRLTHTLVDYGDRTFRSRWEREFIRAAEGEAESSVAALLDAGRFERNRLTPLASRSRYAVSFSALVREGELAERHVSPMIEPPPSASLRPFRLAIAFGVIPARCGPEPFGINDLAKIKTEVSKCAMAACGVIDWKLASRRVRAIYCLRALIAASRQS